MMSQGPLWLIRDAGRARRQGTAALLERQRARLAEMVAFARVHSPYYRELYQGLPERVEDPRLLPVTNKKQLMARFDDWVTDPEVTLEKARSFVNDPSLIGKRFLDKYLLMTTSGTTGTRGIFLIDDRALKVMAALSLRATSSLFKASDVIRLLAGGLRSAQVIATGGHFAAFAAATRQAGESRFLHKINRVFSVHTPLPELVVQLNEYRPVIIEGYASMLALLAGEQEAGRLHLHPALIVATGEGLAEREYQRLARAFHTKVFNLYACNECPSLSYGCQHGWLHVHSDWIVFEPVDADYQPTPPGEQSHTVLLSTLYKWEQPILRYDLGDSIMLRPDPCPCGNPLPAIRVRGRAADLLTFPGPHGTQVATVPLAIGTLIDRTPGVELFQMVQTTPTNLRVRLKTATGTDQDRVWQGIQTEIRSLLASYQLDHVTLQLAEEAPEQAPGGKYRTIIPLS